MTQYPQPIIIEQPPRDCIVVDSKKYCRESDMTPHELGVLILTIALMVGYIGALIAISERFDNGWIAVIGIAATLAVFIVYLFFQ